MQHPILAKVLSDIELRNYSEATKDLYLRTCARYLEFLGGRPLEATDESDIRAFSRHLRCDCGLAPKTVNTYTQCSGWVPNGPLRRQNRGQSGTNGTHPQRWVPNGPF